MVSLLSGGIKDVKTLQSRLVAIRAALSTLGDAPSRPTKVFTVATGPLHRFSPNALPLCGLGCHRNEQSGPDGSQLRVRYVSGARRTHIQP